MLAYFTKTTMEKPVTCCISGDPCRRCGTRRKTICGVKIPPPPLTSLTDAKYSWFAL